MDLELKDVLINDLVRIMNLGKKMFAAVAAKKIQK